jgi:MFS transporter, putative metabolite:H+ symporter
MGQGLPDEHDIAGRMDRLPVTALHMAIVAVCALGLGFDTLEVALGSVLSAVFSAPSSAASSQQLSLLLASMYVGAAIGAPLLGHLADRYGRRHVLGALLLFLALTSLGASASDSLNGLTAFRALSGLAIGAYPPIVIAYLTDLLPPRQRGKLIFVMAAFATLGPVAGVFLVRWLAPLQVLGLEAWRWGFIAGGAGAALVGVLFRVLPESPRWLQARGHHARAEHALHAFERSPAWSAAAAEGRPAPDQVRRKAQDLPAQGRQGRGAWPIVAALFFLSPWATVAFPLLTGAVLMQKGFKLSDTLLYVALSYFGPLVGTLLAAVVVDRIERRITLAWSAAAMLASGLAFSVGQTPSLLIASSIAFLLFASVFVPAINLYGAELFKTSARAGLIAGAWSLNRVGAAFAPLVLVPLLQGGGALAMFLVIAGTLAGSMALLAFAPPGRHQRAVE